MSMAFLWGLIIGSWPNAQIHWFRRPGLPLMRNMVLVFYCECQNHGFEIKKIWWFSSKLPMLSNVEIVFQLRYTIAPPCVKPSSHCHHFPDLDRLDQSWHKIKVFTSSTSISLLVDVHPKFGQTSFLSLLPRYVFRAFLVSLTVVFFFVFLLLDLPASSCCGCSWKGWAWKAWT